LETLGDSFLKFAVSCDVYQRNLGDDEGRLSGKRVECISNERLCDIALGKGWEQLFFFRKFEPKRWARSSQEDEEHMVSRKTLADFVEALIGANYVDGGTNVAMEFVASKLGLISTDVLKEEDDLHKMDSLILNLTRERGFVKDKGGLSSDVIDIAGLEALLDYHFVNRDLAIQALSHSSIDSSKNTYQRLEFLGDAVLDWLITRFIFNSNPSSTPGDLSILRQAIVSNESLGVLSLKLGLFRFVIHEIPGLERQVDAFKKFADERQSGRRVGHTLKCPKVCVQGLIS
jgi:endoribonuclease Dicer